MKVAYVFLFPEFYHLVMLIAQACEEMVSLLYCDIMELWNTYIVLSVS